MIEMTQDSRPKTQAQASLEVTVALIGALLLLFGSLKIFLWINDRLVRRQQAYESTRAAAGRSTGAVMWNEPSAKLSVFK